MITTNDGKYSFLLVTYQFYLNQKSTSNDTSLEQTLFYNCSLPRFDSFCQYEFDYYHPQQRSLDRMIHDFYYSLIYEPIEFTYYMYLQCDRDPSPSYLDWSEICDGKIDCHNRGVDEEHCRQFEVNEYRCANGQCILRSFHTLSARMILRVVIFVKIKSMPRLLIKLVQKWCFLRQFQFYPMKFILLPAKMILIIVIVADIGNDIIVLVLMVTMNLFLVDGK